MPKGPLVTEKVEALIARVSQEHPKWKAKEVRNFVESELRKNNPQIPRNWPGLSVVQKTLATVRRKARELPSDPQEKPWSMGTLDEHPMSPGGLPAVLRVLKLRNDRAEEAVAEAKAKGEPKRVSLLEIDTKFALTMREAKWVARMCNVIADTAQLEAAAVLYARLERLNQLTDHPNDTRVMDNLLADLDSDMEAKEISEYLFGGVCATSTYEAVLHAREMRRIDREKKRLHEELWRLDKEFERTEGEPTEMLRIKGEYERIGGEMKRINEELERIYERVREELKQLRESQREKEA